MMNSNFIHNVLNVVIALTAAFETFLLSTGCTFQVSGAMECSHTWMQINPGWLSAGLFVLGTIKLVMNAVRDGPAGMIKPQPPVADKTDTVVVASPSDAKVTVVTKKG